MANIQNDRDVLLQSAPFRIVAIDNLSLTANVGSFVLASGASTLTPSSVTLTTSINTYTSPTYTWYTVTGGVATLIAGQVGPNLVVSAANFQTLVGSGTSGTYRVVITQAGYPSRTLEYTVLLIREGNQGPAGLSGQSIKASTTAPVFNLTVGGAATPSSATCSVQRSSGISGAAVNSDYVWSVVSGTFTGSLTTVNSTTGAFGAFDASAITSDSVTFKCIYTVSTPGSAYLGQSFTDFVTVSKIRPGQKFAPVSAYMWLTSTPAVPSQAASFTWSNSSISAFPSGWVASPPVSPGSGYTLYQLNVLISEPDGSAISTNFNWSSGTIGTIGYRQDGTIGPQGPGSRIAYIVTTSSTPPALGAVQPVSGDTLPNETARPGSTALNTWSATPKATLAEEEFMYQSDGVYDPSTNKTTWQPAYLSNLKVGNLSALSAKLGVVEVAASGALYSGKATYASTSAGFHLGYSGSAYTFAIGNSGDSKSLRWDGSNLTITGGTISGGLIRTNPSGNARFEISTWSITGYSSDGSERINLETAGGTIRVNNIDALSNNKAVTVSGYGGDGIYASSYSGKAVYGISDTGVGVEGRGNGTASGVKGTSTQGFGGEFSGNATRANLKLPALTALPSNREAGSVCFYGGNLCIANGTHWFTFTGMNQLT